MNKLTHIVIDFARCRGAAGVAPDPSGRRRESGRLARRWRRDRATGKLIRAWASTVVACDAEPPLPRILAS
jgi:hypothetical protein